MAVAVHNPFADDCGGVCFAVFEEVEAEVVGGLPGPAQDVVGVAPDEVGGRAAVVDEAEIGAVEVCGEHSCDEAALAFLVPSVEENKAFAVGGDEEVVEPVFCAGQVFAPGDCGDLREGDDEGGFAGFEVDAPDAGVFGGEVVFVGVIGAGVTVAGAHILYAAEVGGYGGFAVGGDAVDGGGNCALLFGEDVHYAGDEFVAVAVIVDYL